MGSALLQIDFQTMPSLIACIVHMNGGQIKWSCSIWKQPYVQSTVLCRSVSLWGLKTSMPYLIYLARLGHGQRQSERLGDACLETCQSAWYNVMDSVHLEWKIHCSSLLLCNNGVQTFIVFSSALMARLLWVLIVLRADFINWIWWSNTWQNYVDIMLWYWSLPWQRG